MEYFALFSLLHVAVGVLIIVLSSINKETDEIDRSALPEILRLIFGALLGPLAGIAVSMLANKIYGVNETYYCYRCGRQMLHELGPCSFCDKVEKKYPVLKIDSWQCDNCGTKVRGSNNCPGCNQPRIIEVEPDQNNEHSSNSNHQSQKLENTIDYSGYNDDELMLLYKSDLNEETKELYRLELIKRGYLWFLNNK